jgi:hypothetical protein
MNERQTGNFFDNLANALGLTLEEIGLPLTMAIALGVVGCCCALWTFCSSIWLTKRVCLLLMLLMLLWLLLMLFAVNIDRHMLSKKSVDRGTNVPTHVANIVARSRR